MIPFVMAILVVIIAVLLIFTGYLIEKSREERAKLINAIIAKNAAEARDLAIADKTQIKIDPQVERVDNPDFIPEADLDQDQFEEAIHNTVTQSK